MGRCLATPFIIATTLVCMSACTLLSELDDLRAIESSSPQNVDGGFDGTTNNAEGSSSGDDDSGEIGTILKRDGGAADHATTPFDASGFPGFDASIVDSAQSTTFTDDFERPNGDPLGNGWIERAPVAFVLANGAVSKVDSITAYRDNIVYRPASEDLLDVEITLQMRATDLPFAGNPQLWVRAQKIGPNVIDGYHIYFDDGLAHFHLARHVGAVSTEEASFDAENALEVGKTYRLLLRATGTSPVAVYSSLSVQNGTNWTLLAETGFVDNNNNRIQTPGSVGFSADHDGNFVYDNFTRIGVTP